MTQDRDTDDDQEIRALLRAAVLPEPLDQQTNDALIQEALAAARETEEPGGPEEQHDAQELQRALDYHLPHPLLEAATVLRNAIHPEQAPLHPFVERRLLQHALQTAHHPNNELAARAAPRGKSRNPADITGVRRLPRAPMLGAVALAAAAAFLIWFRAPVRTPDPALALRVEQTTEPLLTSALSVGDTSQRMDRIAEMRTRDYRANRYLAWGLR